MDIPLRVLAVLHLPGLADGFSPGSMIALPEARARELIAAGMAEEVPPPSSSLPPPSAA